MPGTYPLRASRKLSMTVASRGGRHWRAALALVAVFVIGESAPATSADLPAYEAPRRAARPIVIAPSEAYVPPPLARDPGPPE